MSGASATVDLCQEFLDLKVVVKTQDNEQVQGQLVHVDWSQGHDGGSGNLFLFLEAAQGFVLVKGSMVISVLKK